MTITEQITSQIDAVVQSIGSYSTAVQAENQRTNKVKSDAAVRYTSQKNQIQQQLDAQIRSFKDTMTVAKVALNMSQQEVSAFEQELERLIPRSRVNNIPPANGSFSAEDACALIARIKETGFWAWIKKLFSIGNYSRNTNMAAELYGRIDSANNFFRNAHIAEETKCRDKIRSCEQSAKKRMAAVDAQYQQDLQNENIVHSANVRTLAQQEQKLSTDPRIDAVQKQLTKAISILGAKPDGWQTYIPAKAISDDLLIGVILWPCKIGSPSPEASKMLKKFANYVPAVNGFNVPLTVPMNKPILMYAECDAADVKLAASIYQSIIARMIRFMPPKALRTIFFDPVNRGTSLGQLIHLSGDGTSQVCEYHLSPQDINTQMSKLTEHVDKVCRRLTSTGCSDINAYNSIPKVARIPYTAVVIHDYPNGFDSTSLGYLQVLINKADQCGIWIMISHKKDDKIEHKALEVLNLINQCFDRFQITTQAKVQITKGASTYMYKPNTVNMTPAYYDEINKLFTYKAPLENGFKKIFGTQLPTPRSSVEGLDIPFAVAPDGSVVELKLGYDLAAHGFVSGGTGSGKTTLLHMIITSAIMHYEPSELELWLVDYKETEFAFYTRNCPPHVRYVVADESAEISFSIIDEIKAELAQRRKAFIAAAAEDYPHYRASAYGKKNPLPKILVIIDEFATMVQAFSENTDYKTDLENILAKARSHGVYLLFCDQFAGKSIDKLTPDSKKLLNVRIAMRNAVEDIRNTLALESVQITDTVKSLMLDTSSGVQGTAIYKYEVKDKDNQFSNKVIIKGCRGIYATDNDRTNVITMIWKQIPQFNREKTFFVGAARQRFDVQQIKSFEKHYPQNISTGERFYIGTPLGIQHCFYFNLKPAESGENILLVGNNQEKRISILKSTLSCAGRYGYNVKILASKASLLYRQNKDFFNSLSTAEVITSFPLICKYVGEKANQLKNMYSDDDDFEFESNGCYKELAIFVGLDEIYAQMDASPLNQKTAWTVMESPNKLSSITASLAKSGADFNSPSLSTPSATPHTMDSNLAASLFNIDSMLATIDADGKDEAADAYHAADTNIAASLSNIDSMPASIGADSDKANLTVSMPERYAGPEISTIKGYNATTDLAVLFSDGWKIGINSMVVVDRGTVFSKMRLVKLDGNFNHRIALVMSPDEAQGFMSKTRVMRELIETNDSLSAVYEYLGGREQSFRPFIYD